MVLIFIRDGSFDISVNDASLYSREDINLFISLICTSDVWLSPFYYTFVCEINNNNNNNNNIDRWDSILLEWKKI